MKNEGQKTYKVGNQTALFLDAISKGYGFSDTVADAILLHYGQAQGAKIIEEFNDAFLDLMRKVEDMLNDTIIENLCDKTNVSNNETVI